jgi:hypothetical protein
MMSRLEAFERTVVETRMLAERRDLGRRLIKLGRLSKGS